MLLPIQSVNVNRKLMILPRGFSHFVLGKSDWIGKKDSITFFFNWE